MDVLIRIEYVVYMRSLYWYDIISKEELPVNNNNNNLYSHISESSDSTLYQHILSKN